MNEQYSLSASREIHKKILINAFFSDRSRTCGGRVARVVVAQIGSDRRQ